jgi:hypothetical protein
LPTPGVPFPVKARLLAQRNTGLKRIQNTPPRHSGESVKKDLQAYRRMFANFKFDLQNNICYYCAS